jgi:alcohol dehydrogenase class IV
MERLAAFLGISGGFDGFLDYVMKLRSELGIPGTIAEIGVDDRQFERMAEMAVIDPTAGGNPVKLTKEAARKLFEAAYQGR